MSDNISKNMRDRLELQADEALDIGFNKTATHLKTLIKSNNTRNDDSVYKYSKDEFTNDVEQAVWKILLRTADFYGCTFDAKKLESFVDHHAKFLISEASKSLDIEVEVGKHEPTLPGEKV